jgi:hypothetical protein
MLISLDLADDETVKVLPSHLFMTLDNAFFGARGFLSETVQFASQVYRLLSPCYGFITLAWMPPLGVVTQPSRGLPGWGWATWLGPEYNELVPLKSSTGLTVEEMPDGGRLYICARPDDVGKPDARTLAVYARVANSIEPDLFQPAMPEVQTVSLNDTPQAIVAPILQGAQLGERNKPVRIPKFRFVSK